MTKPQVEILRAIAGLPDDDWQPEHWAVFTTAQDRARREEDREDRAAARRTASRSRKLLAAGTRAQSLQRFPRDTIPRQTALISAHIARRPAGLHRDIPIAGRSRLRRAEKSSRYNG